jgi:Ca2+-binding RTX toxin-like protein
VSFSGQSGAVRVDLAAGTASRGGAERDTLAGLEDIAGGDGDDLLLGDAADNSLEGDAGDDRLGGRGGDDYLLGDVEPNTNEYSVGYTEGTDGADTLHGGDGDDRLDAGGESGDALDGGPGNDTLENGLYGATRANTVRCGTGRDAITFAPSGQRVSGCELLRPGAMEMLMRPVRRANGRLRFAWSCGIPSGCRMAIGVRVGSSKLARRRLRLRRTRGEFLLRPRRAARRDDVVDVTILFEDGNQTPYAARWRVVV